MGDDKNGSSVHKCVHAALNDRFGAGIDGGSRFVKDHNRRIRNGGSCDGDKLALTLGKSAAVAFKNGVITFRKHTDKAVGIRKLCRGDAFFVGGIRSSVTEVFHNRAGEKVYVLKNNAHGTAKVVFVDITDIDSVIGDGAVFDIVKMVDKVGDGGFACAGCADKGNFLSRFGIESYVVKNTLAFFIGKINVLKVNFAFELTVFKAAVLTGDFPCPLFGAFAGFFNNAVFLRNIDKGDFAVVFLDGFVDEFENSLCAGGCHDNGVYLVGNVAYGLAEASGKLKERSDGTEGERGNSRKAEVRKSGKSKVAAHYGDDYVKEIAKTVHKGHDGVCELVCVGCVITKLGVASVEGFFRLVFVVENLDYFLSVYHFFNIAVHSGDGTLRRHEIMTGFAGYFSKELHHEESEDDNDNGEPDALEHHGNEDESNGKNGLDNLRNALGKHLAKGVRVIGIIAHNVAVAVGIEIFDGQPLHMAEHGGTDILEDILGDLCHGAVIEKGREYTDKINRRHEAKGTDERGKIRA